MIEKKYRIERNTVQFILKKGKDSVSKLFIIRYIENDKGYNRYSIVVSKKISPLAVVRNKLRRQTYEAIRKASADLKPKDQTFDIVLIPKKNILNSTYEEIESDIYGQIK